ncbi:MAG: VTT domain-containing protein [Pirellulales bacterium]
MQQWVRLVAVVAFLLAVPLLVAAAWGQLLADDIARWGASPPPDAVLSVVVIGVLAADLLLPVPSGPVMTLAGAQLGTLPAVGITWLGLMLGSTIGFALGRYGGRPMLTRFVSRRDLTDLDAAGSRHGLWVLLVTRPMPILAEASVIVAGMTRTPWWPFLAVVAAGNLICSLIFCTLGDFAAANEWITMALFLSVVVPVLLLVTVRHWLPRKKGTPSREDGGGGY